MKSCNWIYHCDLCQVPLFSFNGRDASNFSKVALIALKGGKID